MHPAEFPLRCPGKPIALHAFPVLASGQKISASWPIYLMVWLFCMVTPKIGNRWVPAPLFDHLEDLFFPLIGLFWGVLLFIYNYHYLYSNTRCIWDSFNTHSKFLSLIYSSRADKSVPDVRLRETFLSSIITPSFRLTRQEKYSNFESWLKFFLGQVTSKSLEKNPLYACHSVEFDNCSA